MIAYGLHPGQEARTAVPAPKGCSPYAGQAAGNNRALKAQGAGWGWGRADEAATR